MIVQPGAIKSDIGKAASAVLDRFLTIKSRYYKLRDVIYQRANASQVGSTTAEDFAQQLVLALSCPNPAYQIRIGNKSKLLPLMKRWLPIWILDPLLTKKFGLRQLQE